jgi:hypothetical protein
LDLSAATITDVKFNGTSFTNGHFLSATVVGGVFTLADGGTNAATATDLASYPALCTGANFSQGLSSGSNNCATPAGGGGLSGITATGSVNALIATFSPAVTSLAANVAIVVTPNLANTIAAPTLTANSLGAMTITTCGTQALQASDYIPTKPMLLISDGTYLQLQNPQSTVCSEIPHDLGTVTTSATITPVNGKRQTVTLTDGNTCVFGFTQPLTGEVTIRVTVTNGATGTALATWTGIKTPNGVPLNMTLGPAAVDVYTFTLNGSTIKGTYTPNFK